MVRNINFKMIQILSFTACINIQYPTITSDVWAFHDNYDDGILMFNFYNIAFLILEFNTQEVSSKLIT